MTFEEAEKLSLSVKWKLKECHDKNCWCAQIVPETPIVYTYNNIEDEYYIVGSAAIRRAVVEKIIEDHNTKLQENDKE